MMAQHPAQPGCVRPPQWFHLCLFVAVASTSCGRTRPRRCCRVMVPPNERPNADPTADPTLVPIPEAAARLGVSTDAIRMRLKRGTLAGWKLDGRWGVVLPQPNARPNA